MLLHLILAAFVTFVAVVAIWESPMHKLSFARLISGVRRVACGISLDVD